MKLHDNPEKGHQLPKPSAERKPGHTRGKRRILFEVQAPPGAEVFVAGNFNEWDSQKHRLTDKGHPGHFRRFVYVEPGTIEYKFHIDGAWEIDSNCPHWVPNRFGSLNSVIETG